MKPRLCGNISLSSGNLLPHGCLEKPQNHTEWHRMTQNFFGIIFSILWFLLTTESHRMAQNFFWHNFQYSVVVFTNHRIFCILWFLPIGNLPQNIMYTNFLDFINPMEWQHLFVYKSNWLKFGAIIINYCSKLPIKFLEFSI